MEIKVEQGTADWLNLRKNKIGGSDAACILGIGFKSPEQLWKEKLGLSTPFVNDAMRRGTTLEPKARKAFEKLVGKNYRPGVFVHDEHHFMMASLDGINEEGDTILEIKCGNKELHDKAKNGIIPSYYMAQLQHQMYVLGVEKAYYYSYTGEEGHAIVVLRDDKYIADLIPKEKAFWESLQTLTMPERGYIEIESPRWKDIADRYVALKKLQNELMEEEKYLRSELAIISNNEPARGFGLTLTKCSKKGNVEYGKIPELKGVDLEAYRKPSTEYWRVLANGFDD